MGYLHLKLHVDFKLLQIRHFKNHKHYSVLWDLPSSKTLNSEKCKILLFSKEFRFETYGQLVCLFATQSRLLMTPE